MSMIQAHLFQSPINYKTTFRIDKSPIISQEGPTSQTAIEAAANSESLYKFDNISNLNIYASTILRNDLFANNKTFNKFCGPMVGEVVYISGLINSRSNYFFDPATNQEYSGPVHLHPSGRYMEGSEHSESPHKTLRLVEEENYKIILAAGDSDMSANTQIRLEETTLEGGELDQSSQSQTYTPPSY